MQTIKKVKLQMKSILSLISKYAIILALGSLFGNTWFYLKHIIFPIDSIEDINFWHELPTYSNYLIKIIVTVLLVIDVKKYKVNYYLIPIVGFFYPLVGICAFLILLIYTEIEKSKELI